MLDRLNPRSARRRVPAQDEPELPDGGFYKAMSLAMLASVPLWGLLAWGIRELWRAAPDLTVRDWAALACSTTLCWMLAVPIARVIKRKAGR